MELYLRGYRVRGLADPRHWLSPLGAVFERFGSVKASPVAAGRLLRQREAMLLFPGGAREVGFHILPKAFELGATDRLGLTMVLVVA